MKRPLQSCSSTATRGFNTREYFNLSCIKTECIYRQKIQTIQQAKRLVDQYIWFYNNEPIQLKAKLTPLELRRQFTS